MSKDFVSGYLEEAGLEGPVNEVERGNVVETYNIGEEPGYYLQIPGHEPSLKRGILGLQMQQDEDIPVPEIVDYSLEEPYLITETVPGETLEETSNEDIYRHAGSLIAKLHSQDHGYDSFGLMNVEDEELVPAGKQTWKEGLNSIFHTYMSGAQKMVNMGEAAKIDIHYDNKKEDIPANIEPALSHFDFTTDNIIQNNQEVTGVLDWDMIRTADPDLEVIMTENRLRRDGLPFEAFRQGYEQERKPELETETENLYNFISKISKLSELQYMRETHDEDPDWNEVEQIMGEINELIDTDR